MATAYMYTVYALYTAVLCRQCRQQGLESQATDFKVSARQGQSQDLEPQAKAKDTNHTTTTGY